MSDCPYFCDRRHTNSPEVFELEGITNFFFLYDSFPVTPGHTLIIPKRHFADFVEINDEESSELPRAVKALYKHLESTNLLAVYKELYEVLRDDRPKMDDYIPEVIERLTNNPAKPDGYNHGLNDGESAGRTVHHLHYHIMPRWSGDVGDPRGGVRHMFQGKGNYRK